MAPAEGNDQKWQKLRNFSVFSVLPHNSKEQRSRRIEVYRSVSVAPDKEAVIDYEEEMANALMSPNVVKVSQRSWEAEKKALASPSCKVRFKSLQRLMRHSGDAKLIADSSTKYTSSKSDAELKVGASKSKKSQRQSSLGVRRAVDLNVNIPSKRPRISQSVGGTSPSSSRPKTPSSWSSKPSPLPQAWSPHPVFPCDSPKTALSKASQGVQRLLELCHSHSDAA